MPIFPTKPNSGAQSPTTPPAKKAAIPQSARWRPTAEEAVEIEDLAYTLLSSGLLKSQIKKHLKKWAEKKQKEISAKQPGIVISMDARTIERYLSRAKERMVEESGKTKDELRCDSLNYYLSITRDLTADPRSRIQARERIDRLYGLDMPIKVAPTDPTGEQSYKHLSDADLEARIAELAAKAGAGTAASDVGGTAEASGAEGSN